MKKTPPALPDARYIELINEIEDKMFEVIQLWIKIQNEYDRDDFKSYVEMGNKMFICKVEGFRKK